MRLSAAEWATARQHCTTHQLQALDYWRHGYGYKRIGIILDISRDAARGRIDRALATLKRELVYPTTSANIINREAVRPPKHPPIPPARSVSSAGQR